MPPRGSETQPRLFEPTLKSILLFPFRLCNPPPAVGKVRSCSVTPLIKIRLEDVLDRKHLPPLGLKDFEEWLLYVETAPENLYFILWLKEYTVKYQQWAAESKTERDTAEQYCPHHYPAPSSSYLAMFYARAKQTFFMPNSVYELDVSSDILAPFHAPDLPPHPEPALFNEISIQVHRLLAASLDRFVQAQLSNVGTNRVLCGLIAGVFFCILGSVAPLVLNMTHGYSRWNRLAAFPGLWIGLAVFVAALNGICLSVYVLGDLRQLHRFELARPCISNPQPLRMQRQRPSISLPLSALPPPPAMVAALGTTPRTISPSSTPSAPAPPPPALLATANRLSRTTTRDSQGSGRSSRSSQSSYENVDFRIEISGAFYDADPIDGPATSPISPASNYHSVPRVHEVDKGIFTTTAGFIHPYDSGSDLDSAFDLSKLAPEERQLVLPFDFDTLPERIPTRPSIPVKCDALGRRIVEITSDCPPLSTVSPRTLAERIQIRCNLKKWFIINRDPHAESLMMKSESRTETLSVRHAEQGESKFRKHFRDIQAVPAFTSLTRVLSPVVIRGQWEIVTRSLIIAFFLSWIIMGSLLAVPVTR